MHMYKYHYRLWAFVWCFVIILCLNGCADKETNLYADDDNANRYYSIEDFSSIIINESTIIDVDNIAPGTHFIVQMAYGGYEDYPMKNGHVIRIEYYGPDLTVGSIQELTSSEPW